MSTFGITDNKANMNEPLLSSQPSSSSTPLTNTPGNIAMTPEDIKAGKEFQKIIDGYCAAGGITMLALILIILAIALPKAKVESKYDEITKTMKDVEVNFTTVKAVLGGLGGGAGLCAICTACYFYRKQKKAIKKLMEKDRSLTEKSAKEKLCDLSNQLNQQEIDKRVTAGDSIAANALMNTGSIVGIILG